MAILRNLLPTYPHMLSQLTDRIITYLPPAPPHPSACNARATSRAAPHLYIVGEEFVKVGLRHLRAELRGRHGEQCRHVPSRLSGRLRVCYTFTCTKGFERGRLLPTYPPDVQTAGRKIITYVPLPPILAQSYLIPDKT